MPQLKFSHVSREIKIGKMCRRRRERKRTRSFWNKVQKNTMMLLLRSKPGTRETKRERK